jgi:hypothetical protein
MLIIGGWHFRIDDMWLSRATINFDCVAALPGGTVIPSPSPAAIRALDGALVYAYTYDQGTIEVPPGGPHTIWITQTISFMPGGPRADLWRVPTPAGQLPGPGRALGGGGPREIGR